MIEAAPRPLAGVLGPRAGAWLTALHRAEGVVAAHGRRPCAGATSATRSSSPTARASPPRTCSRASASGPATGWLAGSGLDPAGVRVDGAGRTGLPGVFAAGDVTGAGHWEAAARGGAAVARALLGRPRARRRRRRRSGATSTACACSASATRAAPREVARHGDLAAREFELDHLRDGRTTAVLLAGRPPSALRAARARLDHHRHRPGGPHEPDRPHRRRPLPRPRRLRGRRPGGVPRRRRRRASSARPPTSGCARPRAPARPARSCSSTPTPARRSTPRRGSRHIRHSGGPPNGSRNSERTSKPWRA